MRYSQILKRFKFSNGSVNFDPAVSRFDVHQAVIYLDVKTKFHSRMFISVWDTVKFSNGSNSQTVQSISTRQSPDSTWIKRWYTLMLTPNFIPGCWSVYEIQSNSQTVQILKRFSQFRPGSLQIRRASCGDIPWCQHQISFPDVDRRMRYSCGRNDQMLKRFKFSNGSVNFDPAVTRFDVHQAVIYLDVTTKFRSRMFIGLWDTAADGKTERRTDVQTYRRKDGRRHRRTDRQTNGSDHNTWPA